MLLGTRATDAKGLVWRLINIHQRWYWMCPTGVRPQVDAGPFESLAIAQSYADEQEWECDR